MKILLLPKESYPTNRPMLRELWAGQISGLGVDLFWVMQAHLPGSGFTISRERRNTYYILPKLRGRGIVIKLVNQWINLTGKLLYAILISFRHRINALHVHCGPEEGLIGLGTSILFHIPVTYAYTSHFLLVSATEQVDHKNLRALLQKGVHRIRTLLYKRLLRSSDLVFPISPSLNQVLHRQFGVPSRKLLTVPECASDFFLNHPGCSPQPDKGIIRLVYTGSLGRTRNIPFLIDTFEILHRKLKNTELILIGWGHGPKDIPDLKTYAGQKGLETCVHFLPPIPYHQIPDLISRYDIGLSLIPPTERYCHATPTKCVEYMALKLPVVANREIPDQKQILACADAGLLTDYHPMDAARKLFELAQNKDLRHRFGQNGYQWIKKNRTFKKIAPDIVKRIRQLSGTTRNDRI